MNYRHVKLALFVLAFVGTTNFANAEDNGCKSPENKPDTQKSIDEAEKLGCKCRSGFRTADQQKAAFARSGGRPGVAAPPGESRHEQGLAFDCPTVIECPNGYKRLVNESHKDMSHCSDNGH